MRVKLCSHKYIRNKLNIEIAGIYILYLLIGLIKRYIPFEFNDRFLGFSNNSEYSNRRIH